MGLRLRVDGREVEVDDDGASLLEVLRDRLGLHSPKDGCGPQGQCGCCTVLVDGQARVACVTPARRVAGRTVTTFEGLPMPMRQAWAEAFAAAGASQCGFCTPGIIVRLVATAQGRGPGELRANEVEAALVAHLCRCTGWRTIVEAATVARGAAQPRDAALSARRAALEGGTPQQVGPNVALGAGGFADDTAPPDALVAVADGQGGWAVGETLTEARAAARKVQGRRTTLAVAPPLAPPPGAWRLTLQTCWVEPAYLEPDASWCRPGGEPATVLANGGAFGAKLASRAPAVARELADRYDRPVRVLFAREDVVRWGPKRPPIAAGIADDGSGTFRVVRTPGIAAAVASVAPGLTVEEVAVAGPPTSVSLRASGWAEASILTSALRWCRDGCWPVVVAPNGAVAAASVDDTDAVYVTVACGPPLDEVVLRSYAIGAAHQAMGWVTSEGLAVDAAGEPQDLTIRSFGILRARDTPAIEVTIVPDGALAPHGHPGPDEAVNGSDAVFAAVASAMWISRGLPPRWPTGERGAS